MARKIESDSTSSFLQYVTKIGEPSSSDQVESKYTASRLMMCSVISL